MVSFGDLEQGTVVPGGVPDSVNDATLGTDYPGLLGKRLKWSGDVVYQLVKLDSGASPTPAANQCLGWKTRSTFIVTNKLADTNTNEVCGILRNAATAGNYIYMLIKGPGISVKYGGSGASAGDSVILKASGVGADSDHTAKGTAAVSKAIGIASASSSGGNVATDVDLT